MRKTHERDLWGYRRHKYKNSPPCGGEYENGSNKTLIETNVSGSINH